MDFDNVVTGSIRESIAVKEKLLNLKDEIIDICDVLVDCLQHGNKILIAGNGGSAADAQHMAAELVGRFKLERKGLPCIALTTDTSIITAWTNDYDFNTLFERQLEALGTKGDVFIGISTSGNSQNIIKAVEISHKLGITTVLFLGKDGGMLKNMGNYKIIIPSHDTPRIQESHITLIHIICDYIEQKLFANKE